LELDDGAPEGLAPALAVVDEVNKTADGQTGVFGQLSCVTRRS
jgi:hypothetical protein